MKRWCAIVAAGCSACFGEYDPPADAGAGTATTSDPTTSETVGMTTSSTSDATTSSTSDPTTTAASGSTGMPSSCHVDVLVVADISMSMLDFRDGLIGTFIGVGQAVEDTLGMIGSYHIGFTYNAPPVTNANNFPANVAGQCTALGSLLYGQDEACAAELDGRPYVTQDDNLASSVLCLGEFDGGGAPQLETPQPLDALIAALDSNAEPALACNEGFHAPGEPLIIVFLSDAEDQSALLPIEAATQLVGIEGDVSLANVALLNVAADPSSCPAAPDRPACSALPACRIEDFIRDSFGAVQRLDNVRQFDICDVLDAEPAETAQAVSVEFEALVTQVCES